VSWQLKGTGVMMLGLVMAGLAGCGGGGSGGGNGLGTTVPQQPIKITQANAVAVAGVVLEAVLFDDINPGSIVGTASVTTRNPTPRSRRFDLAGVMRAQLKRFPMLATQTGVRIAVVIPPTQLPCAVSGTVIISGEIADPTGETLSPGDTLQGTYDNCNEGDGVVVSGKMLFVVQSISGDLDVPPYDYTVTVTFSNLSFSDTVSGERLTLSGLSLL